MYKPYKFPSHESENFEKFDEIMIRLNEIYPKQYNTELGKKVAENMQGFTKQFDTELDVIDAWIYDPDLEEKVFFKLDMAYMFSSDAGLKHYLSTDRHKSKLNLTYDDVVKHNLFFMTGVTGLCFTAFNENYEVERYEVVCNEHSFDADKVDLSLFSHIYTITDVEDKVVIYGSTKEFQKEIMKARKLTPIKIVDERKVA